jgi:hypothetical protein
LAVGIGNFDRQCHYSGVFKAVATLHDRPGIRPIDADYKRNPTTHPVGDER